MDRALSLEPGDLRFESRFGNKNLQTYNFRYFFQDPAPETTINMEEPKPEVVVGPTVITRSTCPYSGGNPELSNFRSGLNPNEDEEYAIQFEGAYKHYGCGKSRSTFFSLFYSNATRSETQTSLAFLHLKFVKFANTVKV